MESGCDMAESFDGQTSGMSGPACDALELDLSEDDADFACSRALYVGTAGNVKAQMKSGAIVTFTNVVAGCERPWRIKKIFKVGTTASGLVALW